MTGVLDLGLLRDICRGLLRIYPLNLGLASHIIVVIGDLSACSVTQVLANHAAGGETTSDDKRLGPIR